MTEEIASMPTTIPVFSDATPSLAEVAAELSAELQATIESATCTVCREHYSAATRWMCSCFSGFAADELDAMVSS
jgi:hypothetical protein